MSNIVDFRARRRRNRLTGHTRILAMAALVGCAALGMVTASLSNFRLGDPLPNSLAGDGQGASVTIIRGGKIVPVRSAPPRLDRNEGAARVSFGRCGQPPHRNCVVDGDTFYLGGQSIRLADIDAPEIHAPGCASEARLGMEATHRLQSLLNGGPIDLRTTDRDQDRFGRKLRVVVRGGRSLGSVLISEGLAREWTGRRVPWCS
jgi:endonuclease YncB( thermonuclease family)